MVIKIKAKPLVWEPDGEGTIIAYNGSDGPFQIDEFDDDSITRYQAQRNSIAFDDCQGDTFDTLEEAISYCQKLQQDDIESMLEYVFIEATEETLLQDTREGVTFMPMARS
ncbi:MAG TPA: hypothetical protein VJ869_04090 [Sphaerochaeta sp.]|nr:hypothetical protein [Sphaerochaeta sp.]